MDASDYTCGVPAPPSWLTAPPIWDVPCDVIPCATQNELTAVRRSELIRTASAGRRGREHAHHS